MPSYKVTDPTTGKSVTLTGDSPPTEAELTEIFSTVHGSQPRGTNAPNPAQAQVNLMSGMSGTEKFLVGAGKGMMDIVRGGKQAALEVGNKAGLVNDKTVTDYNEFLKGEQALYQPLKDSSMAAKVGEVVGNTAPLLAIPGGVAGGVAKRALTSAGAGAITGALQPTEGGIGKRALNAAEGAGMAAGASVGLSAIGKVGSALLSNKPLDAEITKGIEKGIRPSVAGKRTAAQSEQYFSKAKEAVKTILDHKENLSLTNEEGDLVKGELPQNLKQFSQAIDQTKDEIFKKYNAMAESAGEKGAEVDLKPIANEIKKVADSKVLKIHAPAVAEYAASKAEVLSKAGTHTAQEAQEAIKIYNQSLDAFYKSPSYDNASKAYIDSLVVNNLRKSLDDVIEKSSGKGYQELKNIYGALKTIEKDVNHRAIVDARKSPKGLIDFSDIFSGERAVRGLITMNPAVVGEAVAIKGISALIKRMNDPNRIIKNMFERAEKIKGAVRAPWLPKEGEAVKRFATEVGKKEATRIPAAAVTQPNEE